MNTQRRQRRSWGKIRQLRHGSRRWQASYIGPDLARHPAPSTYTSRMDAEHWLSEEHRMIERDTWTPPKLRAVAKHSLSRHSAHTLTAGLRHATSSRAHARATAN